MPNISLSKPKPTFGEEVKYTTKVFITNNGEW